MSRTLRETGLTTTCTLVTFYLNNFPYTNYDNVYTKVTLICPPVYQYCQLILFGSTSFAPDSSGQLDVSWHYGDSSCMNTAKIGILKQVNKVCLGSFL